MISISKGKATRLLRNRRTHIIGSNEGGSTFKVGDIAIIAMILNGAGTDYNYFKVCGNEAICLGYQFKQRESMR